MPAEKVSRGRLRFVRTSVLLLAGVGCSRTGEPSAVKVGGMVVEPEPLYAGLAAARISAMLTNLSGSDVLLVDVALTAGRSPTGVAHTTARIDNPARLATGQSGILTFVVAFSPPLATGEHVTARLRADLAPARGEPWRVESTAFEWEVAATAVPSLDADGDGLEDDLEIAAGTSPLDADSDDDGMPDADWSGVWM